MNLVELELDETLADFEVQDWIDNVFSVQYPDVKARIKKGCSGLCHKKDEWHYVKDGLPTKDGRYLICNIFSNNYVATNIAEFNSRTRIFGCIENSTIYAWKEIVLPEEE